MLATFKNYDSICYQLKNNFYSQLQNPLKKDLDKLSKSITNILISGKKIQVLSVDILEQIYNFRIKALKWLSEENNLNYLEMLSEVSNEIEEIGKNKKMEILKENILFALRCNKRVVESFINNGEQPANLSDNLKDLPDIDYKKFLTFLFYTIPDNQTAQKILDWTNSSLYVEFVILATGIIIEEKMIISDKTINELAFLIANSAQEYLALATELGFIKTESNRQEFSNKSFNKSFIKQQKEFAEIGIEDFEFNFKK